MSLARILSFAAVAVTVSSAMTACSGGVVNVGSSEQHLKNKTDGGATGNGQTCSFDDVVWYDAETGATGTIPSADGEYSVGQTFKSPDGCNDCTCTTSGITCTERACASPGDPGPGCTEEAKLCPDGTSVGRTGPNCEFAPCPGGCPALGCFPNCPNGIKKDANGCETCQCEDAVACTEEAMLCPDGKTYVSRTGPNCAFAPCP